MFTVIDLEIDNGFAYNSIFQFSLTLPQARSSLQDGCNPPCCGVNVVLFFLQFPFSLVRCQRQLDRFKLRDRSLEVLDTNVF